MLIPDVLFVWAGANTEVKKTKAEKSRTLAETNRFRFSMGREGMIVYGTMAEMKQGGAVRLDDGLPRRLVI